MVDLWPRLVVALDLDSENKIKKVINQLSPKVKKFKIGPVAFVRFGPKVVGWAQKKGADVFLDLKLYDIPNTMAETGKALVDLNSWAFTVHLKAGSESIALLRRKISGYAKDKNKREPLIFGVTELTSEKTSFEQVLKLAKIGEKAGCDAIVCSVWEAARIKKETGLLTVTPGIRPACRQAGKNHSLDDQKRTATLTEAVEAGSDYFIVGRPIVQSDDFFLAAENLIKSAL